MKFRTRPIAIEPPVPAVARAVHGGVLSVKEPGARRWARNPDPLGMIVTHLNVPVAAVQHPLVSRQELAEAFRSGTWTEDASALAAAVCTMFSECSASSIAAAALEIGVPLSSVHRLYQQTLRVGAPSVPAWEQAMETLAC